MATSKRKKRAVCADRESWGVEETVRAAAKCCGQCSLEQQVERAHDYQPKRWVEKIED